MCSFLYKVIYMMTREQFYKSKQWESFRLVIIAQHTDPEGYVHCSKCGKAILKKYDLIIHHKVELSDANVNDYNISLNPDNCECVCFRCHNKIHDRFTAGHAASNTAGFKPVKKHVYIVYGSPCAGKSTWIHSVADPEDLVVDIDSIWQMISVNDRYDKPAALKSVVFQMRDALYDIIKYRSGKWHTAFIITGGALQGDRERLKQRVGADDLIFIDTDQNTCLQRAAMRDEKTAGVWIKYINDWFEKFQPETRSVV